SGGTSISLPSMTSLVMSMPHQPQQQSSGDGDAGGQSNRTNTVTLRQNRSDRIIVLTPSLKHSAPSSTAARKGRSPSRTHARSVHAPTDVRAGPWPPRHRADDPLAPAT